MQDVVSVFRVSSGDSIFDEELPVAESIPGNRWSGFHRFSLRLRLRRFDYRSNDGDEARIYTIDAEMSNLFDAVRRVFPLTMTVVTLVVTLLTKGHVGTHPRTLLLAS